MTETLLGARYRLDEMIGRGGMASVWKATDTVLNRLVAVKRLHPGLLSDEEHAERFRREAILVARLSHPNLVHLLDRGEDPDGPFLVMELIEGETLKSLVRREGALPAAEAAHICAQVARALAYAHGQGVVHRDIKAQNVLLTPDGRVKLTDFGIARVIEGDGQPGITRTDMLVGSADYLSPEQADGRPVGPRADIYSLGIVLYECLTGELPFRGEGFVAVAMKHCTEPLPDPRAVAPVPDWLAACVMCAAAKDPADRFDDAVEMVNALEAGEDGRTLMMPAVAAPAAEEGDEEETGRHRRDGGGRRRRLVWFGGGFVIAAAAVVAALLLGVLGGDDDGTPKPVAQSPTIPIAGVTDYDPDPPGDGQERTSLLPNITDADPSTEWTTETYYDRPDFAGKKPGVGLEFELRRPAVITQVLITSSTSGATFQILGPAPADGGDRPVLGQGTLNGGTVRVPVAAAPAGSDYLIWFTELAPAGTSNGHLAFRAAVGKVQFRGVPNST
ncbi:MAG: protein kinase [Thermoleophilia bacterium]